MEPRPQATLLDPVFSARVDLSLSCNKGLGRPETCGKLRIGGRWPYCDAGETGTPGRRCSMVVIEYIESDHNSISTE